MKIIESKSISLLFSGAVMALSQNGILEAWKEFADPEIFGSGFTHELSALPLEGSATISTKAWSGYYGPQ